MPTISCIEAQREAGKALRWSGHVRHGWFGLVQPYRGTGRPRWAGRVGSSGPDCKGRWCVLRQDAVVMRAVSHASHAFGFAQCTSHSNRGSTTVPLQSLCTHTAVLGTLQRPPSPAGFGGGGSGSVHGPGHPRPSSPPKTTHTNRRQTPDTRRQTRARTDTHTRAGMQ